MLDEDENMSVRCITKSKKLTVERALTCLTALFTQFLFTSQVQPVKAVSGCPLVLTFFSIGFNIFNNTRITVNCAIVYQYSSKNWRGGVQCYVSYE